jgi:hypothetical protein
VGGAADGHTMTTQLSGFKIFRSTRGSLRSQREPPPATEVPAPPAFPAEAPMASKYLNTSTTGLMDRLLKYSVQLSGRYTQRSR